jgi:hypothetical protein
LGGWNLRSGRFGSWDLTGWEARSARSGSGLGLWLRNGLRSLSRTRIGHQPTFDLLASISRRELATHTPWNSVTMASRCLF